MSGVNYAVDHKPRELTLTVPEGGCTVQVMAEQTGFAPWNDDTCIVFALDYGEAFELGFKMIEAANAARDHLDHAIAQAVEARAKAMSEG